MYTVQAEWKGGAMRMYFSVVHIWILEAWPCKLYIHILLIPPLCSPFYGVSWLRSLKENWDLYFFLFIFFNSPRSAVVSFSFLYSHTLGAATDNNLSTHWQWNHTVLLILLLTVKWLLCYRDRAIGQPLKISVHQWLKTIVIVSINISLTQITDGSVFCYL